MIIFVVNEYEFFSENKCEKSFLRIFFYVNGYKIGAQKMY